MTLTFKDPNGVEWQLWAWPLDGKFDARLAEPADLLAALGQLSTGSDGPSDEELRALFAQVLQAGGWTLEAVRASEVGGFRALFAAGLALGEQKLKAQGWRHVPDTHEVIPKGRHEWVLKSDLDAAKAEVDRLTADAEWLREQFAESEKERTDAVKLLYGALNVVWTEPLPESLQGLIERLVADRNELQAFREEWGAKDGNSPGYNLEKAKTYGRIAYERQKRAEAAESELAATKAKLAEVEREMSEVGAIDGARASLNRIGATRGSLETRAYVAAELYDSLLAENAQTEAELASARRHMGLLCDRLRFEVSDHKTPCPCSSCVFVESAERALASAVPAAPDPRDTELERLRGVVAAAKHWASLDHDDGATYRECVEASKKLQAAAEALASAGTDADRAEATKSLREQAREKLAAMSDSQVSNLWVRLQHLEPEPHRPEAGESGHDPHHDPECASCGHVASDHRPGSCGACCEDEESGDSAKCDCRRFREEEPKPEPQPSGERPHKFEMGGHTCCYCGASLLEGEPGESCGLALPWSFSLHGDIRDAKGRHLATVGAARARFIIERCNAPEPSASVGRDRGTDADQAEASAPERQPEVERDDGGEQE